MLHKYSTQAGIHHLIQATTTESQHTMAVPTYDELLAHYDMDSSIMRETFDDRHLRQFSLTLDVWETLARFLEMPNLDIANIKSHGDAVIQTLKMLECWKQRRGSMATYEAMVKALLQISRTDLAEKVIILRKVSRPPKKIITLPCSEKHNQKAPISVASSSGIEGLAAMSLPSLSPTLSENMAQEVISTLSELEEEFHELVTYIEDTLENSKINLNTITR